MFNDDIIPVRLMTVSLEFSPSHLVASMVEYGVVSRALLAVGKLFGSSETVDVNDVDLSPRLSRRITLGTPTAAYVLLSVPCLGKLRVLGGVDDLCVRHVEVVCATKGFDGCILTKMVNPSEQFKAGAVHTCPVPFNRLLKSVPRAHLPSAPLANCTLNKDGLFGPTQVSQWRSKVSSYT